MKLWRKETAWAILIWLVYVSIFGDPNVLEIIIWPAFTFVYLAFGFKQLQQLAPELTNGRGTQRSSEHPSGKDK